MRTVFHSVFVVAAVLAATPTLARAQSETRSIETPFIWTQTEAEEKCGRVAAEANGRWTGQWRTSVPGRSSFCDVTDIVPRRAPAGEPVGRPGAVRDVDAGPIWNQADAEEKCPRVAAAAGGRWTGQWRSVAAGSSVCAVADHSPPPRADDLRFVEAGPVWNEADAREKCPVAAAAVRGRWSGQWRTTIQGEMSVCGVTDMPAPRPRQVEAGPIWSQADAERKCPVAAYAVHGRWTGQWSTSRAGQMSVCEILQ